MRGRDVKRLGESLRIDAGRADFYPTRPFLRSFHYFSILTPLRRKCCAMAAWMRLLLLVISIAGVAGCRTWQTALPEPKGKSPLRPIELASDGMKLEVLFARLPYGDPEINGPM